MKKTVLVVEDDECILENLVEFLESEGYEAQQAKNGRVALEQLRATDSLPSVIILDLMMPELDGFGFRAAQEIDPRISNIPVILVSADPQLEFKKTKMGVVEYLRKPIDIDKLSEKLLKYF